MVFKKLGRKVRRKLFPHPDELVLERWRADRGDQKLRLNYDLDHDSIVLDAGGYEGQWASDIYARFRCQIHVFEPVPAFFSEISARFGSNRDIHLHPHGVGGATREESIAVCGDSSSIYRTGESLQTIRIVDICEWLDRAGITRVDLFKINIEGGEYELLERLIESGAIAMIERLQVQFHRVAPDSESRMDQILDRMKLTHAPTFQYRFVWESWNRSAA